MNDLKDICLRIKDLREFSDLSSADMAEKLKITEQEYIEYEAGIKDLPINLMYAIASELSIEPTVLLLGKNSTRSNVSVSEKDQDTEIERHPGYTFVSLATDFIGKTMQPMVVTIKEGTTPQFVKHRGQEFNYVLEGDLRVVVGEKEYFLSAGDSIYFNPEIPHAQLAMSKTVKFLTVINE